MRSEQRQGQDQGSWAKALPASQDHGWRSGFLESSGKVTLVLGQGPGGRQEGAPLDGWCKVGTRFGEASEQQLTSPDVTTAVLGPGGMGTPWTWGLR